MALNKDNNFLQSDIWRKFQEAVGCRTFYLELKSPSNPPFEKGEGLDFSASIIEHNLPMVGKYLYVPRGPVIPAKAGIQSVELDSGSGAGMTNLIKLAKKNNAGWIRIEPENAETPEIIKKNIDYKIIKAPHDMQPREILVMNITKSEEELLAGMKSKTRYNIKLAEKHGVKVFKIENNCHPVRQPADSGSNEITCLPAGRDSGSEAGVTKKYISEFIRLVKLTADRKGINFHPENYYRKMLEIIPSDILKLYVAEYENKVIAANLVIFYGDTATYLHGAMDDEYRNVMAPYLLQWQAIKDAKKAGCLQYDFGGVKRISPFPLTPSPCGRGWLEKPGEGNWSGITKFKLGFAPATEPVKFPGSFDLILKTPKYFIYRLFSRLKSIF